MRQVFLIVLGAGVIALIAAFLLVGAFPPRIVPHEVSRAIPTATLAQPAAGTPAATAAPAVVLPPIPAPPASPAPATAPATAPAPGAAPPR